jgi:FixJ family two-component response regulator
MAWPGTHDIAQISGRGSAMIVSPRRIAILDDDQSVRTAIGRLLKTAGMNVVSYASSMGLLNSIETEPFDCVVLDLQMPGMSGMDVLRYFRHADIRTPVVIITAHDEIGSPAACLAAGAAAYLRKPLDADELIRAIGKAIQAVGPADKN